MKERRKKQSFSLMPALLKSTRGESIAEVLVAVLIAALAMLLAATLIVNSTGMVKRSTAHMSKAYDGISQMEQGSASGTGKASDITIRDEEGGQVLESGKVRVIRSGDLSRYTAPEADNAGADGSGSQAGNASGGNGNR